MVVPRTQGFCDTVDHEVDGFLFNPGDAQDAAKYIMRLRNDMKLRSKMGAEGQKTCENRTIEAVVADMLNWYQQGWGHWKRRLFLVTFSLTLLMVPCILFGIVSIQSYLYLTDFMVNVLGMKIVEDLPAVATDSGSPSEASNSSVPVQSPLAARTGRASSTKSPARRSTSKGRKVGSEKIATGAVDSVVDADAPHKRSRSRRRSGRGSPK